MCPDVTFNRRPVMFKQEAVKRTGTGAGSSCSFEWSLVGGSNNALHTQAFTRGGDLCSDNTCKKKSCLSFLRCTHEGWGCLDAFCLGSGIAGSGQGVVRKARDPILCTCSQQRPLHMDLAIHHGLHARSTPTFLSGDRRRAGSRPRPSAFPIPAVPPSFFHSLCRL
eukprot:scaffold770_cov362-Pavlova_lutheri.AAC.11